MGEALCAAYRDYLDRMIDESLSLVDVDVETVPDEYDLDDLTRLSEWCSLV